MGQAGLVTIYVQKKLVQVPDAQMALIPRHGDPVGSLKVLSRLGMQRLAKQMLGAAQLAAPQM